MTSDGEPEGRQVQPGRIRDHRAERALGALLPAPEFETLLESAAKLQRLVPDAVMVGGSAAVVYAGHRYSVDHDHVLADLRSRFDMVLDALEREGEWVTNRARAGKIILGELGGIETGIRQLIRARPLETQQVMLRSGNIVTVPTFDETLRIKAFLIVKRNQVRDYLDVAALSDRCGTDHAATVLSHIDDYYRDEQHDERPVASQLVRQLVDPEPADSRVIDQLTHYKGLDRRWTDWARVTSACRDLAHSMIAEQERAWR